MLNEEDGYFYKWYPQKYLNKTLHLTAEEDGIYRRLIDHYMIHRVPLPEGYSALARIAGVDTAKMEIFMVEHGYFFKATGDGKLHHEFCNKRLDEQDQRSKKRSASGKKSAEKRKKQISEKQEELNTRSTNGQQIEKEIEIKKEIKKEEASSISPSTEPKEKKDSFHSSKEKNGTRFSSDIPTTGWYEYAKEKGMTKETAKEEFEKFGNFWMAKSGKDATKKDWFATWRNWCINWKQRGGNNVKTGTYATAPSRSVSAIKAAAEALSAMREGTGSAG